MIISIYITAFLLMFSMILKNSRMFYFLDFSWMWIQLAYCTDYTRIDYHNYVNRYNSIMHEGINIKSTEYGYALLNKFFATFDIDFSVVNAIMMLLTIICLASIIPKYTNQYTSVAGLFMLYPLFMNGIQLRFFIASTIVLYAFKYLLDGSKKSITLYVLFCIIATLFHSVSIIYILFIIPRFLNGKKLYLVTVLIAFMSFVLIKFFENFFSFIFGAERFENKTSINNTIIEVLMIAIWQIFLIFIIVYEKRIVTIENTNLKLSEKNNLLIKVAIFSLILIPLYKMDFSMERIFRNNLVLFYCYIFNMLNYIKLKKAIFIKIVFGFWFVITIFIFNIYRANHWITITKMYLSNNDFVNNLQSHTLVLFLIICFSILFFCIDYREKSNSD